MEALPDPKKEISDRFFKVLGSRRGPPGNYLLIAPGYDFLNRLRILCVCPGFDVEKLKQKIFASEAFQQKVRSSQGSQQKCHKIPYTALPG